MQRLAPTTRGLLNRSAHRLLSSRERTIDIKNPPPRYSGIATFFRAPHVDMHAQSLDGAVDVALLGVPYDGGVTSRSGCRHGPREVRSESAAHVRRVNQATGTAPFDAGLTIADVGDAHVTAPFELNSAHDEIQAHFDRILAEGALPLSVGGDHSCSLPILRAFGKARKAAGLPPLGLLHVDAHADTGDSYAGSRFHHGAPFKIAVDEGLIDPKRTIQIGIRGSLAMADQWDFSHASGMRVMYVDECLRVGPEGVLAEVARVCGAAPTYLTFDIDALDPAYAPGTGTPEVGGLSTHFAQQLIRGLGSPSAAAPAGGLGVDLVGCDLVEVSPPFDAAGITSLAAANLLFEMLCVSVQAKTRRLDAK